MYSIQKVYGSYAVDSGWKYLYGSLLIFSLCSGSVIPIIYTISSKCRHHPAQIVLILCKWPQYSGILEMITCYQLFLDSVCFMDLISFLNKTIHYDELVEIYFFFGKSEISNQTLCRLNQAIILVAFLAQLNYYAILTLDFIITLKKPFMNTKLKLFSYNCGACLFTVIFACLEWDTIANKCSSQDCEDKEIEKLSRYFMFQLLSIGILLILSIYFGIQDLKKMKKINITVRENRKKLFINHIILITTLLLMWSLPLILGWLSDDVNWNSKDAKTDFGIALTRIYFAIMLVHPSILLWIRLREPYFKDRTKLLMKTLLCRRSWKENKDENEDNIIESSQLPLNKLVQEQTNQETVQNILSSILKIVIYDQRLTDLAKQSKYSRSFEYDHSASSDQVKNSVNETIQSPLIGSINDTLELTLSFKITEFAPAVFQDIREKNGICHTIFQKSLRLDLNKQQILKTQESLGKSGSFFFYTYDDTLVLKTIGLSELSLLTNILHDYYIYVSEQQSSLLSKVYGLYTISIEGFSQIHLMLMENIFQNMPKEKIVYDLKGSLINRKSHYQDNQVVDVCSSFIEYKPQDAVFKDVNFIKSTDIFIELNQLDRDILFNILKNDLEFLQNHKLMDYSLLLAVSTEKVARGKRNFTNSSKSYCFGLIDYTQQFTLRKQLEYFYKFHVKRKGDQISCVDPGFYCSRFFAFINSIIIINNNA